MFGLGMWTMPAFFLFFALLCGGVWAYHSLFGEAARFEREQRRFERDMLSRKRD